jgi:putative addiction module killer protein
MPKYTAYETSDYKEWLATQSLKLQRQVHHRILNVEQEGHFGHHKHLEKNLWELKFNDGRRIYYSIIPDAKIILLIGGNKNGQAKDVQKASKILSKIHQIRSR